MRQSYALLFLSFLGLLSCGTPSKNGNTEEPQDEMRLRQYIVQGKQLYQTNCLNCHQSEGQGFAKLYPPLAKSDYLLTDLSRAACLIKNGQNGAIEVNGVIYNQMMPGFENLAPIEIAEIVTYISNAWGNEAGLSNVSEVTKWLEKCQEE
ncbi:MAG: cytochrome c551 [Marinoscillum sp.]|jgi:cytochrome c551